ncbi:MAG: alpha/beta fold hydrolase, partial [Actinobacteria bacterium]|nr:alpha/beta fold hydrolase [Actinomycetota bacterium]
MMILPTKLLSLLPFVVVAAAFGPVSGASAQAAQISWTTCPKEAYPDPDLADELYPELQCGTFKVPYDYGKPNGKQFTLALQKLPASGTKTGTLFTNPGGPGAPGLDLWGLPATSPSLRKSFDLVGFDPRGVGETRPAFDCEPAQGGPPNVANIPWVQVTEALTPGIAKANRACQRKSADFIAHVGTNNVVRDLDAMRAAVGDAKLNFWGMSYGTRIGYVYAYRYPQRVRAIILDAPISPNGSVADYARRRSGSSDEALRFIRSVSPATYAAVIATRDSLFASRLDIGTAGRSIRLGGYDWLNIIINQLSAQTNWPQITALAKQVAAARIVGPGGYDARAALRKALSIAEAEDIGGMAPNGGALSAISCADYADRPSARQRAQIVRNVVSRAPVFGGLSVIQLAPWCAGYTFRADPVPSLASRASLARVRNVKLAISDATADASTPLVWGRAMARAFPSAFEVTQETGNHVNFLRTESDCVDGPLREYLLTLKMAPRRTTCLFTAPEGLDMS